MPPDGRCVALLRSRVPGQGCRPHQIATVSVLHGGGRGKGAPFPAVDRATRTELGRPTPLVVHDGTAILKLLEMMKRSGLHMAIVADEYGSVEGLATITDILGWGADRWRTVPSAQDCSVLLQSCPQPYL